MSDTRTLPGKPRISIVGAGIAGLSLACLLTRIGIAFTIYEARKESSIGHNYAIKLHRHEWRGLVKRLKGKSVPRTEVFRQETACDRLLGGNGQISDTSKANSATFLAIDRNVRKFLVQRLVENDVQVRWEHKLVGISGAGDGKGARLEFEGKPESIADIVIDSGGLGSSAFGQGIEKPEPPKLLPYATYYGTRRISIKDFEERFAGYFGNGNIVKILPSAEASESVTLISVQKIHLDRDSATPEDHTVELRWVFSRPPKGNHDPLWRPGRAKDEAKVIPPEFAEAVSSLVKENQYSKKDKALISELFKLTEVDNDRVLNWHLRLQLPSYEHLAGNTNRDSFQIVAIGDAAHGLPILESHGAMVAMTDAKELARSLQDFWSGAEGKRFDFYSDRKLYSNWEKAVQTALQRIREVHGQEPLRQEDIESLLGRPIQLVAELSNSDEGLSDDSEEGLEQHSGVSDQQAAKI